MIQNRKYAIFGRLCKKQVNKKRQRKVPVILNSWYKIQYIQKKKLSMRIFLFYIEIIFFDSENITFLCKKNKNLHYPWIYLSKNIKIKQKVI